MENATKALLIAAGVLIVILLIALGMNIFNSVDDVSGDADDIGDAIGTQTGTAANEAYQAIMKNESATRPSKTPAE